LVFGPNIFADDTNANFQSAKIEDAVLTLSSKGYYGDLRFHIFNNSLDKLTILEVTGAGNERSTIMARLDNVNYADLGSITLLSEESLDLTTSHIFIRLFDIEEPLKAGQTVKLRLILSTGEIPFSAHVKRY
jgi:copper(I)-binding protein